MDADKHTHHGTAACSRSNEQTDTGTQTDRGTTSGLKPVSCSTKGCSQTRSEEEKEEGWSLQEAAGTDGSCDHCRSAWADARKRNAAKCALWDIRLGTRGAASPACWDELGALEMLPALPAGVGGRHWVYGCSRSLGSSGRSVEP